MSAFIDYWTTYADTDEAKAPWKPAWTQASISRGILKSALKVIASSLMSSDDPNVPVVELGRSIWGTASHLAVSGIRFHLVAADAPERVLLSELVTVLRDRIREAICLCVFASSEQRVWPLPGEAQHVGAAALLPLYPVDIDELASGRTDIRDLIEYKVHRRLVLDKPDPATHFDQRLMAEFVTGRRESAAGTEDLAATLRRLGDDPRSWAEHPFLERVLGTVHTGRNCMIVGPSSSGKSVLALEAGRAELVRSRAVGYLNLGFLDGSPATLFRSFLPWTGTPALEVVVVDDLQSNPAAARYLLALGSTARRCFVGAAAAIVAVSWVEFAREIAPWLEDCSLFAVLPHHVRQRLTAGYQGVLTEAVLKEIADTYGDDIFLLRLALEHAQGQGAVAGPDELAARIWKTRTDGGVPGPEAQRVGLVVGSLGRFDIPSPPGFVAYEAQVANESITGLLRAGLLRKQQANVSMGHRSLCGLLVDWLSQQGCWTELDKLRGPRNAGSVVLDYLKSLGSALAVDSLRALHARAGFKDRPQLNKRAAALVELWDAFTSVLERIEHQQMVDPTWGKVPASALFAAEALSEVGRTEHVYASVAFLRRHWSVTGKTLSASTQGLSTEDDFAQIQTAMREEDAASSGDEQLPPFPSDTFDVERFHRTWLLGLILGVESKAKVSSQVSPAELAELLEGQQLPSGAFYPERVPWSTARVLLGLAAAGRSTGTSQPVADAVAWLLRDRADGGAAQAGLWHSGTGRWNSTLETTAMVLLALLAAGVDGSDPRLAPARAYLLSQRKGWTSTGKELEGALAIQALLDVGGQWEEVASEVQALSRWAKGEALWQGATRSAKESRDQSCRVAQIASHLVSIGWHAIRSDLPGFLDALATPDLFRDKVSRPLPVVPTEQPAPAPPATKTVDLDLEIVRGLDRISLADCAVVGGYRRLDERVRQMLRDWNGRITTPLATRTNAHANFLVWAAPGSGKTFFIQEIARSLGGAIAYFELNLASMSRTEFVARLAEVGRATAPVLCLLDEMDARADETWPYEECFSLLDMNIRGPLPAAFVAIGSSPTGMEGMTKEILARSKGKDLLDRIPAANRFEIPGMSPGDRLVLLASHLLQGADARGHPVREVDKLGLYYTLTNRDLDTPRQLRDLALVAVQRMGTGDDRLMYDDFFFRGDTRKQVFWVEHQEAAGMLAGVFVRTER